MTIRASMTTMGPERRYVALDRVEVRAAGDDGAIPFDGHAAVFNVRTWIGPKKWGFWETIRDGAFSKTIAESDVRMLKNHDVNFDLARSTIDKGPGMLRLSEDDTGLRDEALWIPTTYAQDLAISVRAGVINQQSFGFLPVKEEWSTDEKTGEDTRTLIEVSLFDVSPVTFPAYPETDASMRAAEMGILLEAAGVTDGDTSLLVRSLRTGTLTPDIAPTIRAAAEALGDLARRCEPTGEATRGGDDLSPELEARAQAIKHAIRTFAVTHHEQTVYQGSAR